VDVTEPLRAAIMARLRAIVGDRHVLCGEDVTAGFAVDWTGRFRGNTPAVVRPGGVTEVAAVLETLNSAEVAVVPQGGNTGLVGGSVPLNGEVVLSLTRLNDLEPVDELSHQVSVGAGATLASVQAHTRPKGLDLGVDLAARDSCTIGGMVAANAGGINVVRYGTMREQVLGVEAVLPDGSIVSHLGGLEKDNTGYSLPSLFAGSEGTLGVITMVRLRLRPVLAERVTAMLSFASVEDALAATAELRRTVATLHAIEVVFGSAMDLVSTHIGAPPPAGRGIAWLIVEAASIRDPTAELADAIERLEATVEEVAVATDSASQRQLWRYREQITEAISTAGTPHKMDVTLPAATLAQFVSEVPGIIGEADPEAVAYLFGHLGDGNVHVNVLGPDGAQPNEQIDEAVLRHVAALGGSISAEHGIGTAKREWLHLNRSATELATFEAIKTALDPKRILNPAVLLPPR